MSVWIISGGDARANGPCPKVTFLLSSARPRKRPRSGNEQIKVLNSAVRGLPKRYQVVFVMREYGELSYEEIASSLGNQDRDGDVEIEAGPAGTS